MFFAPSKEIPSIAKQTVKIGAKALWLQYGIENYEAQKIVESANITYVANKCIKQEYQRFFFKNESCLSSTPVNVICYAFYKSIQRFKTH